MTKLRDSNRGKDSHRELNDQQIVAQTCCGLVLSVEETKILVSATVWISHQDITLSPARHKWTKTAEFHLGELHRRNSIRKDRKQSEAY